MLDDCGFKKKCTNEVGYDKCIAAGVNKQVKLECSQLFFQSSWGGNSSFSGRSVGKIKGIWLLILQPCYALSHSATPVLCGHTPRLLLRSNCPVTPSSWTMCRPSHRQSSAFLLSFTHTYTTHTVKVQLYHFLSIYTFWHYNYKHSDMNVIH